MTPDAVDDVAAAAAAAAAGAAVVVADDADNAVAFDTVATLVAFDGDVAAVAVVAFGDAAAVVVVAVAVDEETVVADVAVVDAFAAVAAAVVEVGVADAVVVGVDDVVVVAAAFGSHAGPRRRLALFEVNGSRGSPDDRRRTRTRRCSRADCTDRAGDGAQNEERNVASWR